MLTTRRTRTKTRGKGVFLDHRCNWQCWLGIHRGTGLVSVARYLAWGDYLRWCSELADGRLVRWCLDHLYADDYQPVPKTREYPQAHWFLPRVAETVYKVPDRPDWSELVRLAREARRTLNGFTILHWLRRTGADCVPSLLAVIDLGPFAFPDEPR